MEEDIILSCSGSGRIIINCGTLKCYGKISKIEERNNVIDITFASQIFGNTLSLNGNFTGINGIHLGSTRLYVNGIEINSNGPSIVITGDGINVNGTNRVDINRNLNPNQNVVQDDSQQVTRHDYEGIITKIISTGNTEVIYNHDHKSNEYKSHDLSFDVSNNSQLTIQQEMKCCNMIVNATNNATVNINANIVANNLVKLDAANNASIKINSTIQTESLNSVCKNNAKISSTCNIRCNKSSIYCKNNGTCQITTENQ